MKEKYSYLIHAGMQNILYIKIAEPDKRTIMALVRLYSLDYRDWKDFGRFLKKRGYSENDFIVEEPISIAV